MIKKKIDVDIVKDVLQASLEAYPESTFIKSLSYQYDERGGLSKKQLEGLFKKATKISTISPGRLATLEAMILKRPTRYKSAPPPPKPLYNKDENAGKMIEAILQKFPAHKRVLFFKLKYENNELLSVTEMDELNRFSKLLEKKYG